jgi:DHA2 family multidrug resistance protein
VGLGLVALGIGTLQMVLDKGQELDWFSSHYILGGTIVATIILVVWVRWEWKHAHPIVDLRLLRSRNLAAAMVSMVLLGAVLYGTTTLLPEFLQTLVGYSAQQAGECMALGGFLMMITMPMAGILSGKMDARYLLVFGYGSVSLGLYHMATHLSLGMDFGTAAMLRTYQVAGLAFIFIPSNVLCYAGVPREKNNQVASMMNFVRNVGGSAGIAIVGTMVTRATQRRQTYLTANMQNGNPRFREMLQGLAASLHGPGVSMSQATHQAYGRMEMMVQQQASALAFRDVVSILAVIVMCLIPLAFVMKKPSAVLRDAPPPH